MINDKKKKPRECFNLIDYKSCLKIYLNRFIIELQDLGAPEETRQSIMKAAEIIDNYKE